MAAKSKRTTAKSSSTVWPVIERVRKKGRGDLEGSIEAFEKELAKLDDRSLVALESEFHAAMQRANHWDLWGAANLIHGVISDDMFWDVRAGLVALGQKTFEAALAIPTRSRR